MRTLLRSFTNIVILGVLTGILPFSRLAQARELADSKAPNDQFAVYLPIIHKAFPYAPPNVIRGFVTENRMPLANLPLHLRFFDGAGWSTVATTRTRPNDNMTSDGSFFFSSLPTLGPGQGYYVYYLNGWPDPTCMVSNYVG